MSCKEPRARQVMILEFLVLADMAVSPTELARNFDQDYDQMLETLEQLANRGYVRLSGARCYEATGKGEGLAVIRGSGAVGV